MIRYSVVIPQRDRAAALAALLPPLQSVLDSLLLPYEIICVDDGSSVPCVDAQACIRRRTRVLRFDEPRGTSAALAAGIAAARGRLIIALGVPNRIDVRYVPHLIAHLSQSDLVVGCSERRPADELRHRLARLPRVVRARPTLHASEELFWAARREAVCRLKLPRGAFRLLPELVAGRGYRVSTLTVFEDLPARLARLRPGLIARVAAGWLDRQFEPHLASEFVAAGDTPHAASDRPAWSDPARHPTLAPSESDTSHRS